MSEPALTGDERLALRARAHHLKPVVLLGAAGLTEAVLKETDRALAAHELIKVRIPVDDRDEREAIGAAMAEQLDAARVQSIGKLLVLYRPRPQEPAEEVARSRPAAKRGGAAGRGPRVDAATASAGSKAARGGRSATPAGRDSASGPSGGKGKPAKGRGRRTGTAPGRSAGRRR
jgi:RNA-binding protein